MTQTNARTEPGQDPAPADPGPARARGRGVYLVARGLLLLVLLLAMAAWGAQWVRTSILFVHETDARIMADIVAVSSVADGVLTERRVDEGDRVSRGQILGLIDSRAVILALTETEAELETVRVELARIDAETELIQAQVVSRIASARSRLSEAKANKSTFGHELAFAKANYQRMEMLAETGAVSETRLERARADYFKARQELQKADAGMQAESAALDEAIADRARLTVKAAERAELEARVVEIEARMARQRIDIADRTIISPIDGVVGSTFVIAGEYVSAGERLMVLHDPERIWVESNIRETEVGRLTTEQPVRIEVDAYPDLEFEGRIGRIGNAATSQFSLLPRLNDSSTFTKVTQRIKVRIDVAQRGGKLKPGMMVEIYVDDGSANGFWSWLR